MQVQSIVGAYLSSTWLVLISWQAKSALTLIGITAIAIQLIGLKQHCTDLGVGDDKPR